MNFSALDIETNSLNPDRIWVICAKDLATGQTYQFLNPSHVEEERKRFVEYCLTVDRFVMHNGLSFDAPVIRRLVPEAVLDNSQIVDTLVVSRLVDYGIKDGHSLDAWGKRLGLHKGNHTDWSRLSQEMIDYCHLDVEVTTKLFERFRSVIFDKEWAVALRCEHDMQILCDEMHENGFKFDKEGAEECLQEITAKMQALERGFQSDFPPVLQEVNRLKYRTKADGSLYSSVQEAVEKYPKVEVEGADLVCYDYVEFNPGSPNQRIDRLWEAGWKPVEKTKGHKEFEREKSQNGKSWGRKKSGRS